MHSMSSKIKYFGSHQTEEQHRAARYAEMEAQNAAVDPRGCLDGGPRHPNQYFHRDKGYWICPDCGASSRQASIQLLLSIVVMVALGFVLLFIVYAVSRYWWHGA